MPSMSSTARLKFGGVSAVVAGALLTTKRGDRKPREVAEALGIDRQYLRDLEKGRVDWRRSDYREPIIGEYALRSDELASIGIGMTPSAAVKPTAPAIKRLTDVRHYFAEKNFKPFSFMLSGADYAVYEIGLLDDLAAMTRLTTEFTVDSDISAAERYLPLVWGTAALDLIVFSYGELADTVVIRQIEGGEPLLHEARHLRPLGRIVRATIQTLQAQQ